jgi:hypothetical protein
MVQIFFELFVMVTISLHDAMKVIPEHTLALGIPAEVKREK